MERLTFPAHPENQAKMASYMKNHFEFIGVKSVERRQIERQWLKASKSWSIAKLENQIQQTYRRPEREYQYAAIDLAERNVNRLTRPVYQTLCGLAGTVAWWDSVDAWRKVFSLYIQQNETLADDGAWFLNQPSFWYRRIGITLQLGWRVETKQPFLTTAIEQNAADQQFFIQKAIGWALRDYSKTNPEWVCDQLSQWPELSNLAIREGSKYL